ncbi:MAG: pyrroloquinoline quinone-dependent dehydrogenase [Solibacterales bacterium]|nr:pyrroloquinoline quinone-dependent dehydrogenase [Bryobacterales bacterium]
MTQIRHLFLTLSVILVTFLAPLNSQQWPYWGGDPGGKKYAALDQINKENVHRLKVAWIYDTGDASDGSEPGLPPRSAHESTPLMINGVLYLTTPFNRLFALNSETGEALWSYDPKTSGRNNRFSLSISRGAAYWSNNEANRIFLGDQSGRLHSIDTLNGELDLDFGTNGIVDLSTGVSGKFTEGGYGMTSPVAICGDVIIAGGRVTDSNPQGPSGDIRGLDVRTGEQRWRFNTVPHPGEFGHDTWGKNSWKDRGGTNAWSIMSVDEENELVFLPLTSPAYDFYGGDRPGKNLFSDSVVALDCKTGQRKWHFQTIHHDLWDWDFPSQPLLISVDHNGRETSAVAVITKTGFVFLLDRLNGKPLFEVEERPVPIGDIPGEEYWPTQPFPVKPPPFVRQSMTREEITNVTPESRAECLALLEDAYVEGPLFRPIGERPTVLFPGTNGGANWGGGAFDPLTNTLYINSMDVGGLLRMVKRPSDSLLPYRARGTKYGRLWDSNQYPCQTPPWGHLTAINMDQGEFRWRIILGEFEELTARGIAKTGTPNLGGPIVTSGGLVFIAATNDRHFRAFDKDTGKTLWETRLPASGHATPITYLGPTNGKQYVAIAAGGGNKYNENYMAKLVVFALY